MTEKRSRSLVHAPYNFVPVSAYVHEVDWGDRVSCDVPFEDGVSGHLVVELKVVTPVCVGGEHDQEKRTVKPFKTSDGKLAIPGTSIKGMLRNVVEIATFSKLQLVDRDRRYAVRDLSKPKLYRNHMARSRPGWLMASGDQWCIRPCEMAQVEQQDLIHYLRSECGAEAAEDMKRCFTSRQPVNLCEKYEAWCKGGASLDLTFEPSSKAERSGSGHFLSFSDADLTKSGTSGRLVLTGQPSANLRLLPGRKKRGRFKHREFIFFGEPGPATIIEDTVKRNFELNHSKQQGQKHPGRAEPNDEWSYWRCRLLEGRRVPVFFIEEDGKITSFGLTRMFRLAYKQSVGEAIDNVSVDHHPDPGKYLADLERDPKVSSRLRSIQPKIDFTETLFGYVRGHEGGGAARGRVDVGLFRIESGGKPTEPQTAVLSAPKPTYFPSYIDQTPRLDDSGIKLRPDAEYLTFMDERCEPRGWKRYPARPEAEELPRTRAPNDNVSTTWTAVRKGVFGGKIRFHNVRPAELGAVLWAIDFGGHEELCHTLGYAKPFGYGNVRLRVRSNLLRRLVDGTEVDLDTARESFTSYMKQAFSDWEETEQIVELRAMADPTGAADHDLSYMVLDHKNRQDEFLDAKGRGRHDPRYVLPRYADFQGRPDHKRFPRVHREDSWEKRRAKAESE